MTVIYWDVYHSKLLAHNENAGHNNPFRVSIVLKILKKRASSLGKCIVWYEVTVFEGFNVKVWRWYFQVFIYRDTK